MKYSNGRGWGGKKGVVVVGIKHQISRNVVFVGYKIIKKYFHYKKEVCASLASAPVAKYNWTKRENNC
jgi:hypothetical protein